MQGLTYRLGMDGHMAVSLVAAQAFEHTDADIYDAKNSSSSPHLIAD